MSYTRTTAPMISMIDTSKDANNDENEKDKTQSKPYTVNENNNTSIDLGANANTLTLTSTANTLTREDKAERYPRPRGRVVVVDWWKGFSIFLMLFAHYLTYGVEVMGGSIGSGPGILVGVVQLCNGLFFFLSAFGNYISIKKMLDCNVPLNRVALVIIVRGSVLIGLSMLTHSFFRRWLSQALYVHYSEPTNNFGYELLTNLFDPFVVPYIGFNTAVSSLVLVILVAKVRHDEAGAVSSTASGNSTNKMWTLTNKLKFIGSIAALVLLANILFRVLLDRVTHPIGLECQTIYNKTQVLSAPSRFPDKCYVTHSASLDFSDNTEWKPCFNVTDVSSNPQNVTTWPLLPGFTSTHHGSHERCQDFMKHFKTSLPGVALAHLSDAQRGYRWCPTNVQRDALVPTDEEIANPKLEVCTLTPWWGPAIGVNGMQTMVTWHRLTAAQRAYNFFTWPWLGRYGFFAYGANALLGMAVAMYVCDESGGWTPELFENLYKLAFVMIVTGMGPALALFVLEAGGNETAQMASTWIRLLFGGIELMAFTIFAHVMEGRPTSGCVSCCGKKSTCCCKSCSCCAFGAFGAPQFKDHWFYRMCRRYGAISLTIYIIQHFVFDTTSIVINAMASYVPPFCYKPMYPKDSACGIARTQGSLTTNYGVIFLYVVLNLLFFSTFIWVWQQIHFVGSFEWMIQKILTIARGSKSTSITLNFNNKNRGGDCTCRGVGSQECCNLSLFCCGACNRRRKDMENSSDFEEIVEVSCTEGVAKWGCRAGTLMTIILIGIIIGAQ